MSFKVINIILLFVLILMMGTIFVVRRDYTTRNVELLPGMVEYEAYRPQSANVNFADGKNLQRPVNGAVVRGFAPLFYEATPEDALRAGRELSSPLDAKDSTADLERGAIVFGNICKPCHGAGGAGDGIVPQRGFPPPPSLLAENALRMKDGQMFHVITYGQRNMPSFAVQVTRADRWRVTNFIRSLQFKTTLATVAAP